MDEEEALDSLPTAYATVLRLRLAGHGTDVIAAALGVSADTVPAVVELAEAKLARLVGATSPPSSDG
jgi:DNA-directed RNA polymerase specialized sigma24 family protein